MQDDRIDFSSLDPATDEGRWELMVDSVSARALEARRRRTSVGAQLFAWSRPAMALAATLAAAVWIGTVLSGLPHRSPREAHADRAVLLSRWAAADRLPAGMDILVVLGGSDGSR